jgi:hypothetical protein
MIEAHRGETMTKAQMDVIGREHGIHPRYRREFLKLANKGRIDNDEFGDRLYACQNYQRACASMMHFMARGDK